MTTATVLPAPIVLTKYAIRVHQPNQAPSFGNHVEVYATSMREAEDTALEVSGKRRSTAQATLQSITQEVYFPDHPPSKLPVTPTERNHRG